MTTIGGGAVARIVQVACSVAAFIVLISTGDLPTVGFSVFTYFIVALTSHIGWGLFTAYLEFKGYLVLQDMVTGHLWRLALVDGLMIFVLGSASASFLGIRFMLRTDLRFCVGFHCTMYNVSGALGLMSCASLLPSFFMCFKTLAYRW